MMPQADARARAEFERLYRETREDLLAYLVSRCRDRELAADLFSDTYLIAWRKLDSIPHGNRAKLWLFGVGRNLLLKNFRQRRASDRLTERLANELRSGPAEPSQLDDDTHRSLSAGLAALAERDREILTLTAWEELTPSEIATVIGCSANVVRVRLHRARAHLDRHLRGAVPERRSSTEPAVSEMRPPPRVAARMASNSEGA